MRRARSFNLTLAFAPCAPVLTHTRASSFVCVGRSPACRRFHPCMVANRADEERREGPYPDYGAVVFAQRGDDVENAEPTQGGDEGPGGGDEGIDTRLIVAAVGLLAALTVGGVAAATGALDPDRLVALSAWFEKLGPAAIILYAALYFLLELIGVPALPLTMGSGYLFGVARGTITVSVASTAAAATSFLIARYGLRNSVSRLAQRYPRFRAMDRAIGRESFKFVLLLRLSPLLPFAISNYLYGLTSVNLMPYVAGSWLGMLPGTVAYVSAGAAVSALSDLSAGKGSVNPYLVVLGLVATVGALSTIGRMATNAIEANQEEEVVEQQQ